MFNVEESTKYSTETDIIEVATNYHMSKLKRNTALESISSNAPLKILKFKIFKLKRNKNKLV